ncbi:hypothetical protein Tco_0536559 [Tanacetum coccineum]
MPSETSEAPKGDYEILSKPPGFENFKHQKKHNSHHSFSSCPGAKSSRASKSHSKAFSNHRSMIEALVTQIEMGKVLGYDMEGSTNDLKKLIEGLGAKHVNAYGGNIFNSENNAKCATSVGHDSGGLLSVWDTNSFSKLNVLPFAQPSLLLKCDFWKTKKFFLNLILGFLGSLRIALDDKRIGYANHVNDIPLDWALGAFISQIMSD